MNGSNGFVQTGQKCNFLFKEGTTSKNQVGDTAEVII